MKRYVLPTLALLLASTPTFAREKPRGEQSPSGASRPDQQAMEREARTACLNGDYARGVALLSDLFVDTKDPNFIFNQGRCYEQNQKFEEAIGHFREYLRTGPRDRQGAEKHIAECEALQAKKNASAAAPVTEAAATLPAPTPMPTSPPVTEAAPAVKVTPPVAEPTSSGSGLRIGGIVVTSFGAAALVAGVVLNLKANSLADSIDPPAHAFSRNTESTRSSYETYSWIGYGVGAASIVTGAVLYGIGWSRAGDTTVALVPAIGPGLAGATLRRSF